MKDLLNPVFETASRNAPLMEHSVSPVEKSELVKFTNIYHKLYLFIINQYIKLLSKRHLSFCQAVFSPGVISLRILIKGAIIMGLWYRVRVRGGYKGSHKR
jgi:hypothetical protein